MKQQTSSSHIQVYYRLIALWVFCEAVLGGIIHGLRLPVSGLIVGSSAVVCICLIGFYVPAKGAILKATLLVVAFKLMLSPHSPPAAYLAVLFQGLAGQLLFSRKNFFSLSCILLGVLALAESAAQRVLMMTILYGNDFWEALNTTISKLANQSVSANYSLVLGIIYLVFHLIAGIAAGLFATRLVKRRWMLADAYFIPEEKNLVKPTSKKRRRLKTGLLLVWIVLLLLFIQSWLSIGPPLLPSGLALQIILRSLLIAFSWYFVVGPALLFLGQKWLTHYRQKQFSEIQAVALLLPSTRHLVDKSWQLASDEKGWHRITKCCKIILMNTLRTDA